MKRNGALEKWAKGIKTVGESDGTCMFLRMHLCVVWLYGSYNKFIFPTCTVQHELLRSAACKGPENQRHGMRDDAY